MSHITVSLPGGIWSIVRRIWEHHFNTPVSTSRSRVFRIARNLDRHYYLNRALALPHVLTAVWILILIWGEVWIFRSSVRNCDWSKWEGWPKEASPHHLIFLADPQLIDPHSYPSRPWPLDLLTMIHTDKFLKRSYISLQKKLHPDTIIFLGDLFDGGREWKAARGNKNDASWANNQRPSNERTYANMWAKKYGEEYWLREYDRFGKIFFKPKNLSGFNPGPWQRGRKIISSLPGNHDLGFGDKIKLSIRNRFQVYFGEGNRVDVIGNHTFVSVDTVSLSAGGSSHDVSEITKPVEEFLSVVQDLKRKAVARELGYIAGKESLTQYIHKIEDLATANFTSHSYLDPESSLSEFPTILLTHVPLYRDPGTPCGPLREHWPPTTPLKGQKVPVNPDIRNAISITRGFQYQNVLSSSDSSRLISSIGNVSSIFSGDDHDYCEIVHPADKNNAKEITVKSMSWAMGVRRPGFLLLSMWNPVDLHGKSLHSSRTDGHDSASQKPETTKSHLCLLPDQTGIIIYYFIFTLITLMSLILRSFLTNTLNFNKSGLQNPRFGLPVTQRSFNEEEDNIFQTSSSSASSSGASSLALRLVKSVSPSTVYKYGISDSEIRHTSLSNTNSLENGFYKINDIEESGFWKNFVPTEKKQDITSVTVVVKRKTTLGITVLREAWTNIWHVSLVVLMAYLCLFWIY